jgi:hypothetical protein
MKSIRKAVLFWLSVSLPLFAAGFRYAKIDYPGAFWTRPMGLNPQGDVVGLWV